MPLEILLKDYTGIIGAEIICYFAGQDPYSLISFQNQSTVTAMARITYTFD